MRRRWLASALGLLALLACAPGGTAGTVTTGAGAAGPAPAARAPAGSALARLERLAVRPEQQASTYRRAAFGRRWADVDGNGCDTRDDVLARDLTGVRRRGRCVVVSGTFVDVYSGLRVRFDRARPTQVQIDHVVALAEAWRSGAWAWTDERRLRYANDPAVLVTTTGAINQGKGDQDAGTWVPSDRRRACRYAAQVVAVKSAYRLAVDARERGALVDDLRGC